MPATRGLTTTQQGYDWTWQRLRLAILARDHWRCWVCGGRANTVDHIVALAEGGARYDPTNLRAACTPCNSRRGAELALARCDRASASPIFSWTDVTA